MKEWTPADVLEAGRLTMQFLEFVGITIIIVGGWFFKRDLDGRMSQMIDTISRLAGVPNQRVEDRPVDVERRSKNK